MTVSFYLSLILEFCPALDPGWEISKYPRSKIDLRCLLFIFG
jgi:hypothetical protein